jgi:6-phosphogluconate dehydrogenase
MSVAGENQNEVGVIGLDLTGRNVSFRLAEQGFMVMAFDWAGHGSPALREQSTEPGLHLATGVSQLMASLRRPRTILLFSGPDAPVNSVMDRLLPELKIGDLVMDAGASYYKDTAQLQRRLAERCVQFMGIGLGGGEKGARQGAVVMAGGGREARSQGRPVLEAMSAIVPGQTRVSWFESAAAAHFVTMVHGGIECALMQLLSETLDLLKRILQLTDEVLQDISGAWRQGILFGHLMEISGSVFEPLNPRAPWMRLQEKLNSAKRDASRRWLAHSSWELEVPIPTIEAALEIQRPPTNERREALVAALFRHPIGRFVENRESVLDEFYGAFQAATMITYAQGMAILKAASTQLGFKFSLAEISRAWRGGAQLRAAMLEAISTALEWTPDLPSLLSDDDFSERVMAGQEKLRHAVWLAHELDTAAPALFASLDYLDFDKAAWLPVNLVHVPRLQPVAPAMAREKVAAKDWILL